MAVIRTPARLTNSTTGGTCGPPLDVARAEARAGRLRGHQASPDQVVPGRQYPHLGT
jgi:hypothetical protein